CSADMSRSHDGYKMPQHCKLTVAIEDHVGDGATIGVQAVYRAEPDGYTLLLSSNSHITNQVLFKDLGYDLVKDFAMLGLVTSTPMVLAVSPKVPAKSVKEFTELARANPGKIDYATCGVAKIIH